MNMQVADPFLPGRPVWHKTFGFGTIHGASEDVLTVKFDTSRGFKKIEASRAAEVLRQASGDFYVGQELVVRGTERYCIVIGFDRANDRVHVKWADGRAQHVPEDMLETPILSRRDMDGDDPLDWRKKPKLAILSYDDMLALPDPEWLVDGLIQEQTSALLFGKSNSFKSFLAVDVACSVATGTPWHGRDVRQGHVLYIATEGGRGLAKQRIPGWMEHHGIPAELRRNIRLYPRELALDDPQAIDDLHESLMTILENEDRPQDEWFKLIVVDIFGGSMNGSEITDETARAWVAGVNHMLREMGVAVLTVAHTGWADESRARMHTHFWGSFDTRMKAEGDKEALQTVLTIDRHKDADSSGEWGFQLVTARAEGGASTLVPTLGEGVEVRQRKRVSGKPLVALQALDETLAESGRKIAAQGLPACRVVEFEKWRTMCDRHGLTDSDNAETRRKTFQRAKNTLLEKGLIRCFDAFVWRAEQ